MPPEPASHRTQTLQAIGLIIIGYFGYAVSDLVAKILQNHYSIFQVMGLNAVMAAIITGAWLWRYHGLKALFPENLNLHLFRAAIIVCTAYLMVSALKLLPLADFYGIAFTIPFFTMIMAVLILKEKVGWHRIGAAVFGFCGILVIAGPQFDDIGLGFVMALGGAFMASFNIIILRKIGSKAPVPLYGFWPFVFIVIFCIAGILITDGAKPIRTEDLKFILLAPPFTVLGIAALAQGFTRAHDSTVVSPFHYTQIIWGIGFGWLFFQTLPTATTYLGIGMIILAGLYTLWREYKHKHHIPD